MGRSAMTHSIRSADRRHVPELEGKAENQRPKTDAWFEVKLFRYEQTDLYQWWGREALVNRHVRIGSVFWKPCDEPFVIETVQ